MNDVNILYKIQFRPHHELLKIKSLWNKILKILYFITSNRNDILILCLIYKGSFALDLKKQSKLD